jgi:aminopeptidase N
MAKGFYLSRNLAMAGLLLAAIALVTIIALSVVYDKERSRNRAPSNGAPSVGASSPSSSSSIDPYSSSTSASPGPQKPWQRYRLPDTLAPVHYAITLWPRLEPDGRGLFIFTGNSTVRFVCLKDTDLILIHSNRLNFTLFQGHEAQLMALGATAPAIKTTWLELTTDYLVVQLEGRLEAGRSYLLHTEFVGELADDLAGFYRSKYKENGVEK